MRKILEERLENAKLDYQYHKYHNLEGSRILRDLECEINIYQDCLNLLPSKRTEQEILKDFEELGYEIRIEKDFIDMNGYDDISLFIDLENKTYSKSKYLQVEDITMQEHKLLNELFEVWGWI